jgi:hypothetical protein
MVLSCLWIPAAHASSIFTLALKMKVACTFQTSVFVYKTIRCHNPDGHNLYITVVTNADKNERKGTKTEERKKFGSKIYKKANYIKWQVRIIQHKATPSFL